MILPEIKIQKILYATDLSDSARLAFAYAVSLANNYGASIVMLHVLSEIPEEMEEKIVGYISADQWQAIKKRNLEEAKDSLTGKKRPNVPIFDALDQFRRNVQKTTENPDFVADEILVTYGKPEDEILKQAQVHGCDLIVMGTHGLGTIADAMMGSTARRVLRKSKIPVLCVRLPEQA